MTKSRRTTIEARLVAHITEVGSVPIVQSAEVWNPEADRLHAPFGYSRPLWDQGRSYLSFCPELIAQTTAELSHTDLWDYLTCVEVQLDYYVAHYAMTDDEATQWFDRYVASECLGSLILMNRVQMGWLDRRA